MKPRLLCAAGLLTSSALLAACGAPGSMPAVSSMPASPARAARAAQNDPDAVKYTFATLDDPNDSRFNRLLGLNDLGKIVGYFGSGKTSDPNQGLEVQPPYKPANFQTVDFPDAAQTQVTTMTNGASFGGFYTDYKHDVYGFMEWKNLWFAYSAPLARRGAPVTEIMSMNESSQAVGFWLNSSGHDVPFLLDLETGIFQKVNTPDGTQSAVATGINARGDICGYYKSASGVTQGFLRAVGETAVQFSYPGATSTKPLGLSPFDHVVGSYVDASGDTHGFLVRNPGTQRAVWQTIDDPQSSKATVVTGINLHGSIAGYYIDRSGRNHGFLGTEKSAH
ncbi:MAG: hypothetical protein WAN39_04920 [Candidatus Cybelea sp.]